MGSLSLTLRLATDFSEKHLVEAISKKCHTSDFTYRIDSQSLDARKKHDIHWVLNILVSSSALKGPDPIPIPELTIPWKKRNKKIVVVGSGPAGFFSAFVLQKAGYSVTLIERGFDIEKRAKSLLHFERTAEFDPHGNYAFGEGGAGTFSDGKLTSRSKRISLEKRFILSSYIAAGAPEDIAWMAHPHLGSDHLRKIVPKLREMYLSLGGTIQFDAQLMGLTSQKGCILEAQTKTESLKADYYVVATGHSAYETYRMLIQTGIEFRTKNFAIGSRIEHPQSLINQLQWGCEALPGVNSAEYRLTANPQDLLPVYTFCMCPGGGVVPSMAYPEMNCVN
ncbi:MAG: FAD-dependent protein, partial [Candidatus Margulisiibacteriota bacterium]